MHRERESENPDSEAEVTVLGSVYLSVHLSIFSHRTTLRIASMSPAAQL